MMDSQLPRNKRLLPLWQSLRVCMAINRACVFAFWAELENAEESAYAAERNLATFCETQTGGGAAECVELQDLEQPSGEFSRLMADDDAAEPPKPSRWRQMKALMKVRLLTERRMPSIWLVRLVLPVVLLLLGALRWALPVGLLTFSRLELKAGYYVNDSQESQSAVNPGLAFVSSTPAGLSLVQCAHQFSGPSSAEVCLYTVQWVKHIWHVCAVYSVSQKNNPPVHFWRTWTHVHVLYMLSPVCLSVVWFFGNVFTPFGTFTLSHPLTSVEKFYENLCRETAPSGGVKFKRGSQM